MEYKEHLKNVIIVTDSYRDVPYTPISIRFDLSRGPLLQFISRILQSQSG